MTKNEYITRIYRKLLQENLEEKANSLMNKLNYDEKTDLYDTNEFDYVQENEKEMCEVCGGYTGSEMSEGKMCECGNRGYREMMELGGMDDGHPRFGNKNLSRMSRKEKDDLMSDRTFELSLDRKGNDFDDKEDFIDYDDEVEDEDDLRIPDDMPSYKTKYRYSDDEELDESWYSHDEYERMRNFGSEDELQAYQDKLVSGGEKEKSKKEDDDEEFDFELDLSKEELDEKLYGKQHKLDRNKNGRIDKEDFKMLRKQQDEGEQLYEVEFEKEVEEGETDESREFAYAAMMAKKKGKDTFELDGETFDVKESILYTESDLIDLIEKLVLEEKNKFKTSEPKGYKEYEKAHKADKKENEDYLKTVAKKMTDYLKGMSDEGSKYEMKETKKFPTENGGLKKGIRKKYTPSDAVDDYIDAFSYPGQTNLVFDEIKPTEKNIEKYLKGHRTTGNAEVDDDGNALGNVVPSKTGEKFFQNFKDNLYGQEQMNASYKRQPQPVDQAGESTERGSLKSKRGKKTSQSVLNKVEESINPKKEKLLNEEFGRMQELMGYNRKTQ